MKRRKIVTAGVDAQWAGLSESQRAAVIARGAATPKEFRAAVNGELCRAAPVRPACQSRRTTATLPPRPWTPITRRNLLFFLLPLRNPSRVWQWHVKRLRRYLSIFNGHRLVTIATGGELLDSPSKVRREFGADAKRIVFRELPNDSRTWEAPALRQMLRTVKSTRANEASFYFHAKGVRRIEQTAVRPWCESLYRSLLGNPETTLDTLTQAKACGASMRQGDPSGGRRDAGAWHFSGNAWWVRHDALFGACDWERPFEAEANPWSAEAYLSTRFDRHEVVDVCQSTGDVYDASTWAGNDPWRVSVIVTARNYGRYLRECLESCLWQDARPHEVIYCDDASQDDSLAVGRRFHGVKVIALKKNLGVVKARNHAASKATGNALLFVDGDNVLPRNYLSAMLGQLTNRTPFVYGDQAMFGTVAHYVRQPDWQHCDLWQQQFVDTCSLIRRDAFEAVGGWVEDDEGGAWCAMDDYHLFLRLSLFGAARRANVALGYRKHDLSLSLANRQDGDVPRIRAEQERIRQHVTQWAVKRFGRLPSRAERDDGVLIS